MVTKESLMGDGAASIRTRRMSVVERAKVKEQGMRKAVASLSAPKLDQLRTVFNLFDRYA